MSLSQEEIEQRIEAVDRFADSSSRRYGSLLNWQNPLDPFWHYGIGLSDTHIFDTGRGLRPFSKLDAKFVINVDHIVFEPKQTIERLKHALYVFKDWEYTLTGWNCEHLARLVATDRPRCYQSKLIWWMCNLTPKGDHKSAHRVLHNYLEGVDPSLNR
ncbi:hypothetical protein H6G89_14545 [Oscillatoria sp. FACHB-1407]|uniref:hypothetical protein n=1 Tax=Oscillatoria sp. FACHB-1407 TaxID=2692847 RepID=UPI00168393A3|nr:hypothetical protein [Oscillatoria sp. FACHB-1407]MBD2462264.1 hypothetical protein [Oscillatoria sp. FACHB-1407]